MSQIGRPGNHQLPTVILHPGEVFVAKEPAIISTILGSCVSVCIHCPRLRTGAMCHSVMPVDNRPSPKEDIFRFVDSSVNYMVDILTGGGKICPAPSLIAKIFGGANVLPSFHKGPKQGRSIGNQNIEAARQALAKHRVKVAVEKVGGSMGCKLFFYPHTGDVYYKLLSK